jgi:hypothetical protein
VRFRYAALKRNVEDFEAPNWLQHSPTAGDATMGAAGPDDRVVAPILPSTFSPGVSAIGRRDADFLFMWRRMGMRPCCDSA